MKIIYTGIFFDEETKNKLKELALNSFMNLMENVKLDHITLNFGREESYLINNEVKFQVIGYVKDDLCQTFVVELPENILVNQTPHITVAHSNKVGAKYSNELIKSSTFYAFDKPIELSGKVGYYCQGNVIKYEI